MVCLMVLFIMDQPTIRELLKSSDNSKYMMFSFVSKIILNLYGVWVCSNSEIAFLLLNPQGRKRRILNVGQESGETGPSEREILCEINLFE